MRLIDADELYETISDHVTTVSVCPTVDWAMGKTQFKKMCLEDIKNAPTVDRWISVSDRLPEIEKDVLVFAKSKICGENTITITHLTDSFYFGGSPIKMQEPQWNSPWQYFRSDYVITHWQYLPEPPKEVDTDGNSKR